MSDILPVLSREYCTCGTMCMLCAGSRMLWWSLLIVVASARSPNTPPKVLFDFIPVGIDGSEGLNALAVAPVSLIANGMLPSSKPNLRLFSLLVCCLCVVEVNSVFGIDSDVVCVGQLACAEQGMLYLRYNVYALCWLLDVVVEFVDHFCFCFTASEFCPFLAFLGAIHLFLTQNRKCFCAK